MSADMTEIDGDAHLLARLGAEIDLSFIAVSADFSNPDPVLGSAVRPYAETLFRWADPTLEYVKGRGFSRVVGRSQAVREAGALGYVGGRHNPAGPHV